MYVMTEFVEDHGLRMDESSDHEDPEATLGEEVQGLRTEVQRWRQESDERRVLVGVAQAALESRRVTQTWSMRGCNSRTFAVDWPNEC